MAQFGQSARLGAVRSQVRILLPRLFEDLRLEVLFFCVNPSKTQTGCLPLGTRKEMNANA